MKRIMSYLDNAKALNDMIFKGQILEAFDQFYHPEVTMIEATGESWSGKEANRQREEQFVASVQEIHGGGVEGITSNEEDGTTMVESWLDLTFQDGNRMKLEQVAVQKWQGDQIIKERFYYNAG